MKKQISSYKEAGVDIKKGERFTDFIKNFSSNAILNGIGDFAGGIELDIKEYRTPVLLSTTDGVGTKLLVAKKCKTYATIGIDLVAMCVNDLIVCGAEPLLFLDYIACGKIHEEVLQDIMKGIIRGCEIAHLKLGGGETAEMPDMYNTDDVDLAGFAIGIGEKERLLPKKEMIREGDIIFGLPSSGIHSNGLSLARKVIPEGEKRLWEELLVPTRIYTEEIIALLSSGIICAAAHITGGGLPGNISRVIPNSLFPELFFNWEIPWIFTEIQKRSGIEEEEMKKVFNLGIGIALIAKQEKQDRLEKVAQDKNISLFKIGKLVKK
jgi:phosphoribosylformylglycinamidine cyclo-ligase